MDKYYIPQQLDAPFKIAIFTLDEIALFFLPFLIITFWISKTNFRICYKRNYFIYLQKIKRRRG